MGSYAFALIYSVVYNTTVGHLPVKEIFQYFTMLSAIYGVFVSCILIAFAIDGVRRKRFIYPDWAAILHYSSVICFDLIFFFAVFFISGFDKTAAFGRYNFPLHVICPILITITFFMVESGRNYTLKDSLIGMSPVLLYALVYIYQVVIKANWNDIYHFRTIPEVLSFSMMIGLAFGIATLLRWLGNKKNAYLKNQLTKNLPLDLDPVSVKIEAYGLGRYMGLQGEANSIGFNMDIMQLLSETYDVRVDELVRAYSKGVIEGLKERG